MPWPAPPSTRPRSPRGPARRPDPAPAPLSLPRRHARPPPHTRAQIVAAVKEIKDHKGASRQAITKWLKANHPGVTPVALKRALAAGQQSGALVLEGGGSGRVRVPGVVFAEPEDEKLGVEVLDPGHGEAAARGDEVSVAYVGRLWHPGGFERGERGGAPGGAGRASPPPAPARAVPSPPGRPGGPRPRPASRPAPAGALFDQAREFEFTVGAGEVIRGWDRGVAGMRVGERRRLKVPPKLGYGKRGSPPEIPGDATLAFEITLLRVR